MLVTLALTGITFAMAVVLTTQPVAIGDATGERLDRSRVRGGMLIGLLVVAQGAITTRGGEGGIDPLGMASLLAVGLTVTWMRILAMAGWRPASVASQLAALSGVVALLLLALGAALYVPDPGPTAPRVIVSVDNSFWNRLGLNRFTYVRLLRQQGIRATVVRFDKADENSGSKALPEDADGVLLTGGGDVAAVHYLGDPSLTTSVKPGRDTLELALLAEADRRDLPVLGLCRGAQLLNVYHGGTLGAFRDAPVRFRRHMRHLAGHDVTLAPDSRLAGIYADDLDLHVTTLHGQFVASPGDNVRIVAWADDGTPEAIEVGTVNEFGKIGVQWHAEVPPWDTDQRPLFQAFAQAVRDVHHYGRR